MSERDLYDDVLDFYDTACPLKDRDGFKKALQLTVKSEDLEAYFLIPPAESITLAKLQKISNMPPDDLKRRLERLAAAALLLVFRRNGETTYERASSLIMAEQNVRKAESSAQRTLYAEFFNGYIEGDMDAMRTKTPHYRVLPAEQTIKEPAELRTVDIHMEVPNQTDVLPIDVVSEMIKQDDDLIGVAECGCRKAKHVLGKGCNKPLETCFVFNEYAQSLIETGYARKVDYHEAMEILKKCEERGLIHFVQNCEERIRSLCNCCPCCCTVLRSLGRGALIAGMPSRYAVAVDMGKLKNAENCISRCPVGAWSNVDGKISVNAKKCMGCGLCVICSPGAIKMVLREKNADIPKNYDALYLRHLQEIMSALENQ